jgi:hypothetical protein
VTDKEQEARAEIAVRRAPAIICAVRDLDADDIAGMLLPMPVDELHALIVVLAAAIDPETRLREQLAWISPDSPAEFIDTVNRVLGRRPCGTHAAFNRHKAAGEEPCDRCWDGERTFQRLRGRNRRAEQILRDEKKGNAA